MTVNSGGDGCKREGHKNPTGISEWKDEFTMYTFLVCGNKENKCWRIILYH